SHLEDLPAVADAEECRWPCRVSGSADGSARSHCLHPLGFHTDAYRATPHLGLDPRPPVELALEILAPFGTASFLRWSRWSESPDPRHRQRPSSVRQATRGNAGLSQAMPFPPLSSPPSPPTPTAPLAPPTQ